MPTKIRAWSAAIVAIMGLCSAACGDGDPSATPDAGAADAASPDATPQPVCTLLATSYADLGTVTGASVVKPVDDTEPTGPQVVSLELPLTADAKPDVLFVELWDQTAPFKDGLAAGTFTVIDKQTDLFACGLCAYIAADVVQGANLNFNMASGGTVTIDNLDLTPGTGRVSGSLSMVGFREVTVDSQGQHVVPGGCVTEVVAAAFDFTVPAP